MFRIDGPGATQDNKFTEGNPAGGTRATVVTEEWLNALQEEVAQAIEGDGELLEKTNSGQLLEVLSRRTIHVGNLAALESRAAGATDGRRYDVTGFYNIFSGGGGPFYWDANRDKAGHDGVVVIAPEAIAAWDGTQAGVGSLLNWTGTGTGAFVRIVENDELSILAAGATGNDSENQSLSIEAAFKAHNTHGHKITGREQDTYLIDSEVITKNIDFDGNNCRFKLTAGKKTGIRSSLGALAGGAVAADNNLILQTALSVDFDASDNEANKITLASVAGIQKGQLISVVSNDVLGPARPSVYKRGITSVVQKVNGSAVYLEHTIPYDLTATGSRVVVCTPNTVSFKNARFLGNTVEDDQSGLTIDGAIRPVLENLEFDVFGEASLSPRHCVAVYVTNVRTGRSWWADTQATSYGLTAQSCNGVIVDKLFTFTGRHGFSCGGQSYGLPIDTSGDTRGAPTMGIEISGSKIYPELGTTPLGGGNNNGLDCHAGTTDITVHDSEIYRFQLNVDTAKFYGCDIRGIQFNSSFIGLRPLANGYTSFLFDSCDFNSQRVALRGPAAEFTDPVGLSDITFRNCDLGGDLELLLEAEVGSMPANSIIGNITVDNSERVRISAHDTANLKVDHMNFMNLKGNNRQHYAVGTAPFGSVGHLYYVNCTLEPAYTAVFAQMAESVHLDSIKWGPDSDTAVFKMRFSDASDIFVVNTRMNFGTTSSNSVSVANDGGGGSWYTINSPVLFEGGVAATSFGFASVTEL